MKVTSDRGRPAISRVDAMCNSLDRETSPAVIDAPPPPPNLITKAQTPADAVASQAARLWRAPAIEVEAAWCQLETTGDPQQLQRFAARWLDIGVTVASTALAF